MLFKPRIISSSPMPSGCSTPAWWSSTMAICTVRQCNMPLIPPCRLSHFEVLRLHVCGNLLRCRVTVDEGMRLPPPPPKLAEILSLSFYLHPARPEYRRQ